MKNKNYNIGVLKNVAAALGELNEDVIYVGGAVVGIYADDPAAEDVRPTKDVDFILEIATYKELVKLEEELLKKGFKRDPMEKVECRFFLNDIIVDVMSTQNVGWAPANSWFLPGLKYAEEYDLDCKEIKIFPVSYYLATKFEAYHERGKDPRTSHDFEDIVYVLDNNLKLVKEILNAPKDVKIFLQNEFQQLVSKPNLQEAILGHLYYETSIERKEIINHKLQSIINGIQ